jgi:hypothetical protein
MSPLGANFDPQGRSCPPGVNFVPQGGSYPLGVKFSVRPFILLNSRGFSPLGENHVVKNWPQSSPHSRSELMLKNFKKNLKILVAGDSSRARVHPTIVAFAVIN